MFRPAARSVLRRNPVSAPLHTTYRQSRSFTFGAAEKKSSFKSTFLRWAAVGGIVYYYSTSSVFADEPKFIEERPPLSTIDDERPPSLIDEVLQASRKNSTEHNDPKKHGESPEKSSEDDSSAAGHSLEAEGGPEGLAEEAGQEGAFNPETGEINWDCPCLGGMAHGPCGEQFKTAFSCFVYSTADPKGVDCIDKFKDMQTCFQAHPEIYGAELDDEEAQQSETLKPLDLDNVEETRSPATSSNVPTETVVDPGVAKPDTEPVDADKPEDKVAETSEGVDTEQTKS